MAMAVPRATASLFEFGWPPIWPVCRAERASARPEPREPCIKAAGGGCRIPTGTAGRTQQRIVASRENRKFSQQRRNTTVRTHDNHAAHSHIHVSARLFPVPLVRQNFGSVPLQLYYEGGIPGTDGNAALVLFRGTQVGQERNEMRKFMNRWKSGAVGALTLIVGSVVVIGCGDSSDGTSASVPKDTLVVKGLYMGMPGDDAVKACKEMVGSSKDLVVVDFRNGIEREKDEETKAREKKEYEETVKLAEADIDRFLQWSGLTGEFYDPSADECSARGVEEKDLRPYVASGSKAAPVPGANWVVGTAMAAFAGMYGYQLEWMLPGKRRARGIGPEVVLWESRGSRGEERFQSIFFLALGDLGKRVGQGVVFERIEAFRG